MPDEPNKEFEIKVTFSNVEQAIMGEFKKQIDDVAKAINLLAETMTGQIEALQLIQKDMKTYNAAAAAGGGGIGAPPPGLATIAGGHPGGGVGEIIAAIQDLGKNLERAGGGGYGYSRTASLSGRLGNMPFERNWDQENSFENPQYGNFTFQDVLRQGASYLRTRKMKDYPVADVEERHRLRNEQRQAYVDSSDYDGTIPPELMNDNDYIADTTSNMKGPFSSTRGRIGGMSKYMSSLGLPTSSLGDFFDKSQAIAPYFSQGGVFNPGTYGLGMTGLREKSAAIGNVNRFGMQFGGDQRYLPIGDSAHQAIGAQWQAAKSSWFGLNPFLSSGQAQEIIGSVAGMGYSHGTAEQMRGTMSDVTQHTNIGISTQADIIDKSFRFGYASLTQLADFMKHDMPAAAQAARLNVGQFSQQLVQVATSLSQSTGVDFFTSAQQVNAMVTGTGMTTGQAQAIMGNSNLQWLGASQVASATGKGISIGEYYFDSNRPANDLHAAATRVQQILGKTPEEIGRIMQLPKHDPTRTAFESRFVMMQGQLAGLGITQINDIARLTPASIKRTGIVTAANTFSSGADAAGDAAVAKHQGQIDGIDNEFLRNAITNKIRNDAVAKYGSKEGKAALNKDVHALAKAGEWSQDDIDDVLGTHKELLSRGRGYKTVSGDPGRSAKTTADALAKKIAEKTAAAGDKNSKNQQHVNITLNAGPALQGLITAVQGTGNQSFAPGGTGQAAPPATPSAPLLNIP